MNNRALSKAEAAALIGVCEKTVERMISEGKLRAHKVGGRWKIFQLDLDAFLAGCSNDSKPAAAALAGARPGQSEILSILPPKKTNAHRFSTSQSAQGEK